MKTKTTKPDEFLLTDVGEDLIDKFLFFEGWENQITDLITGKTLATLYDEVSEFHQEIDENDAYAGIYHDLNNLTLTVDNVDYTLGVEAETGFLYAYKKTQLQKDIENIGWIEWRHYMGIGDVMRIIEGDTSTERFPNTEKWIKSCYSMPHKQEILMRCLDELLGTCGVESIETSDGYIDYLNTGDSYTATICMLWDWLGNPKFFVSDWATIVENDEIYN